MILVNFLSHYSFAVGIAFHSSFQIDPVEGLIQSELTTRYGQLKDFTPGGRWVKSEEERTKENYLVSTLSSYYTSSHSKGMDPKCVQVKQIASNLRSRVNKVSNEIHKHVKL